MKRAPVMAWACAKPFWVWRLLFSVSPYHRGYDAGYEQAVKNLTVGTDRP